VETPFPLLKCLRTHYGRHCEQFSGQNALDCKILHIRSQKFSGGDSPDPHRSVPGAWTQTPITAWLASVPIVPVLPKQPTSCSQGIQRMWQSPYPDKDNNINCTKKADLGKCAINFSQLKKFIPLCEY